MVLASHLILTASFRVLVSIHASPCVCVLGQVMLLLREHLLALPPWVRFVVSTAPAGLSREVSLCLATRCVPRLMAPTDMLSARELQVRHGAALGVVNQGAGSSLPTTRQP